MHKLSTNIIYSFLSEISLFAFSFLLSVVIARYLGADGRGRFWLVINTAGFMQFVFSLRFQRSLTYHLSKYNERIGEILLYGLIVGFFTALLSAVAINLFPELFYGFFLKNITTGWGILVLLCFARYLWSYIIAVSEGLMLFQFKMFFMLSSYFLKIVEVIVALTILNLDFDGMVYFMAAFETILYTIIIAFILLKSADFQLRLTRFWEMVKYSLESYPGMLSDLVSLRVDAFFLNFYTGPAQVGIYSVALSLANMLTYLPMAIRNVLLPFIAGSSDQKITPKISRMMIIVMSITALLSIPFIWVLVIPIFGVEFEFARVLYLILLPGMIGWGLFTLLASDIEGRGFPLRTSLVSVLSAVATIVLDIILIPILGSTGAALVSSLTNLMAMVFVVILYRKMQNINISELLIPKSVDLRMLIDITSRLAFRAGKTISVFSAKNP